MVEDYLKVIWSAQEWDEDISIATTEIARILKVSPSSVSGNLKKLSRDGLIDYEPYGAISLTDEGRLIALQVVRRHRLIETYLVERLGFGWDEVHEEADRLEHAVSDRVLNRLDRTLGFPDRDPHGDPIPDPEGNLPRVLSFRLSDLGVGKSGHLSRISDQDPDLLRYLAARGLDVGVHVRVDHKSSAASIIGVSWEADARRIALDLSLTAAAVIRIEPDL